jgi:anti-anti-sigma factor
MFSVRVDRPAEDLVVIQGVGEVDSVTAPMLSTCLHRELEHQPVTLVLDLTGVDFLGVAGLAVLDCALARAETLAVTVNLVFHDQSAVLSALRAAAPTGLFPHCVTGIRRAPAELPGQRASASPAPLPPDRHPVEPAVGSPH